MTGLAKRFIGLAIGVRTRSRDLHSLASRSYENDCGFSVCPVHTGRPRAGGRDGWQEESNIQPFRWFPPRLPLSFFPSWIPPAVCSVCHSPRACDARYHITPHPHVNHVNRRLVIRARTRRAFGTT